MVSQLDGYIQKLNTAREGADDSYLRIASNVEKMGLVATQQNAYLKGVSSMHAELSRAMQELQQTQKAMLQRFSEVSAQGTADLLKAAGEIRATGTMLGKQPPAHRRTAARGFDRHARCLPRLYGRVRQARGLPDQNISDTLGQLPQAVGETADAFLDQVDRLGAALEEANAAINDAVDRLYPPQPQERQ